MLYNILFFLSFFLHFSPFSPCGTKNGGGGFKPLSLFSSLMSLYPSMHKLVNWLLVIDLQKSFLRELLLGVRIQEGASTDLAYLSANVQLRPC